MKSLLDQLRLQTARQRMLMDGLDATSAAYEVGYESVSQFSRESSDSSASSLYAILKPGEIAGSQLSMLLDQRHQFEPDLKQFSYIRLSSGTVDNLSSRAFGPLCCGPECPGQSTSTAD